MFNKKIIFICLFIILSTTYISINYFIGKESLSNLKILVNEDTKQNIKKYFFPHKLINQQNNIINLQKEQTERLKLQIEKLDQTYILYRHLLPKLELNFKISNEDIKIKKIEKISLKNKKYLKKYYLKDGFYNGIHRDAYGSGYIDFHKNNLIILSSLGIIGYNIDIDNDNKFKQIKNNINEFINLKQFNKTIKTDRGQVSWFTIKDLYINDDKIFISYTEEIEEDCWNTSIIFADFKYNFLKFKKLFRAKKCIHSKLNKDKEFNAHQSGGRIINFDKNHILLSTGDYRSRFLSQDNKSINGKIIKININNLQHEILSMGHRNPQGLFFDKKNNFILETEHGPLGGDEINLIEIKKTNKNEILNYGWPIVSAGEHYGPDDKFRQIRYKKYPLYKSHKQFDFIEPLISFTPSIGISEITKINEKKYVVGSLKMKSLYFFEMNKKNQIINLKQVKINERIRDLIYKDGKLYLFLENSSSIGVLSL